MRAWLTALAIGLAVALGCSPGTERKTAARAELLAALGQVRLVAGRLNGIEYAPLNASPDVHATTKTRNLIAAANRITQAAWRHPASMERSAPTREVAADDLALLFIADGHLERAARVLETALAMDSLGDVPERVATAPEHLAVAYLASDLAAVRLALAAERHDGYLAFQALVAAEQAVGDQPGLAEALFNRALALESMGLDWEASAAWRAYVTADPHSGWGREARAHLDALAAYPPALPLPDQRLSLARAMAARNRRQIDVAVGNDPEGAREHVEQELLPRWGRRFLLRREPASRQDLAELVEARAIGAALLRLSGDAMAADSVATIDQAAVADPTRLALLAAGHRTYGDALRVGLDLARSRQLLERAERLLAQGASPFSSWPQLQAAIVDYRRSDYGRAQPVLNLIAGQANQRYPTLRAKALRALALTEGVQGNYAPARTHLEEAAGIYRRAGEDQNLVAVLTLLATANQTLGNTAAAWRVRCEALRLARRLPAAPYLLLGESAIDAFALGQPRIASYFQQLGVHQAERMADPTTLAESLRVRAMIYHRLGEDELARQDLRRAAAELPRIPAADLRRSLRGDLLAVSGEVSLAREPRLAAADFAAALAIYRATGYHLYLSQLHQKRAEACAAAADLDGAEQEYRSAIAERERQRALLPDERQRTVFFDDVEPIFEEAAHFEAVRRGNSELAFDLAERARARSLLDQITERERGAAGGAPRASEPLSLPALRAALGTGTTVVAYLMLEDRTVAWVMTRDALHLALLPVGRRRLAALLAALRAELVEGRAEQRQDAPAAALFHELVSPLRDRIAHGARIVFVPDKELFLLPFAALYDADARHYLIADHPIAVAPSATMLIHALQRDRGFSRQAPARALLVGDPTARGLDALPGARREIESIQGLYGPASTLLAGARATRSAVLAALPGHEVIHFANHSLVEPGAEQSPTLVLADDALAGRMGVLRADDLLGSPLAGVRLVVLAGCDTGRGRLSVTEGPLSLARALLGNGVPAVVAALWPVDDAATSPFFVEFHRRLLGGDDAMAALRAAQLRSLASSDARLRQPVVWAAFELFGGSAPRGAG